MADDNTTEQHAPEDATSEEETVDNAAQEPATGTDEAGDDDKLGTPGKAALAKERKLRNDAERAKREADRARRDLEKQLQEYRDKDKSDTERALARAENAEKRAEALLERAVRAEVRALASGQFEDPEDAITYLREKFGGYSDDGDIDAGQIKADLADLLDRKPHLAKKAAAEPEKRRPPAPDMTQASSANKQRSSSPADEFAGFLHSRLRSRK
ncbi:hypothetical protein ACQEUU_37430 [Nonomuraea sp. CA-218870]|uniref:hypothetical protein n=1 Tax=Nonomuraea sp. CA-218870 TaxID=3239998 RepID=UPI003D8E2260